MIVAAIYAVVWPRPKPGVERPAWRHVILRWGHSAVWLLLATSCFVRSTDRVSATGAANVIALLGGLLYVNLAPLLDGTVGTAAHLLTGVVTVLVFYVCNVGPVFIMISLHSGRSPLDCGKARSPR